MTAPPRTTSASPSATPAHDRSARQDPTARDARSAARVRAWATAIEAGVLARAARDHPEAAWRGDASEEELLAIETAGAEARREFVAANLGLVGRVVGGYARSGGPVADLFQEGCLGLITAVERFDHRRGIRFSTYATYWIRAYVQAAAPRYLGAVTTPANRADQLRSAHQVQAGLAQRLGRVPTVGEVAAAIGRDERWTAVLLGQRGARSLDELDDRSLHRLAAVTRSPADEPTQEPAVWARRLLASLSGLERQVVELRLGFGGRSPASLAGAARALGVSVGRVRRAEVRALEQLRAQCPREVLASLAS